jgi:uncharacterized protein YneF (UPF0154 family)
MTTTVFIILIIVAFVLGIYGKRIFGTLYEYCYWYLYVPIVMLSTQIWVVLVIAIVIGILTGLFIATKL